MPLIPHIPNDDLPPSYDDDKKKIKPLIKKSKEEVKTNSDVAAQVRKPPPKLGGPKAPPLSILQKIHNDPQFTPTRSVAWFRKKISELGGNSPVAKTELLSTTKPIQTTKFLIGSLFIFKYDPKTKADLPYYDTFPCSLIFNIEGGLARGINFHYLPLTLRAKLFDKIWQIAENNWNNQDQVKRLTWKFLGNVTKFPEVRFAVKSYLYTHVRSKLIKVGWEDAKSAILLPYESFAKRSMSIVHYDAVQHTKGHIVGKPIPHRK